MPTETDQPTTTTQAPAEATERAEEAEMKSSYSYGNGASVDVALCACNGCTAAPIIVTSTKLTGQVSFTYDEWDAFVAGVKAGEFDSDKLVKGDNYTTGSSREGVSLR